MYGASDQLFSRSSFSRNQDGRIGRRNFRHLPQHSPQSFGGANDLLKHRRVLDFLSQRDVFAARSFFVPLAIVDIGSRRIPANDLSGLVQQWVVPNQKPSILAVLPQRSVFEFKRKAACKSGLSLVPYSLYVVRMDDQLTGVWSTQVLGS